MKIIQARVKTSILKDDLVVAQYNLLNSIYFYTFTREYIDDKELKRDNYFIGRWHIKPKKLES